jgi:hypothetical protein
MRPPLTERRSSNVLEPDHWAYLHGHQLLLRPKPEPPKPNTSDFNVPLTKEGAEIGKVYGTVWIRSPQIVWWGDRKTEKIKAKQGKK